MNVRLLTDKFMTAVVPTINPITKEYDGEWWITLTKVVYDIDGVYIAIPAGFITNFGSVPKWARGFVDKADQSIHGYLLHDWIYYKTDTQYTRKQADKLLFKVARDCDQSWWEARLAYIAVRVGGGAFFKKHRPNMTTVSRELIDQICYDNGYFPDSNEVLKSMETPKKASLVE